MPNLLEERFNLVFLSLHLYFDPSVGKVSGVPDEPERACMRLGKISKPDPLHLAVHEEVSGGQIYHRTYAPSK